jgi:hypothetical protein
LLGIEKLLGCFGLSGHDYVKVNFVVCRLVDKRHDNERLRFDSTDGMQPYFVLDIAVAYREVETSSNTCVACSKLMP